MVSEHYFTQAWVMIYEVLGKSCRKLTKCKEKLSV